MGKFILILVIFSGINSFATGTCTTTEGIVAYDSMTRFQGDAIIINPRIQTGSGDLRFWADYSVGPSYNRSYNASGICITLGYNKVKSVETENSQPNEVLVELNRLGKIQSVEKRRYAIRYLICQ
jgi:hypothetical protein